MKIENSPHFELVSSHDLFQKARLDLDKINVAMNSYDLFNFLSTLNSLYDWVEGEHKHTPSRDQDSALDIIRHLCNRSKHFKRRAVQPDTAVRRVDGAFSSISFSPSAFGDSFLGKTTYFVTVGETEKPVIEICNEAFAVWKKFFDGLK